MCLNQVSFRTRISYPSSALIRSYGYDLTSSHFVTPTLADVQVFEGVCSLLLRLKIDDPLSAAPMHAFTGMWACLWVGLVAKKDYVEQVRQSTRAELCTCTWLHALGCKTA